MEEVAAGRSTPYKDVQSVVFTVTLDISIPIYPNQQKIAHLIGVHT